MLTIPGTSIPLCTVCEDEPAEFTKADLPLRDEHLGPICADCAKALADAVVALSHTPGICGCLTSKKAKS